MKGITMFNDIANPFGAAAYDPAAAQTPVATLYYKGRRLETSRARLARAPKPLSHTVKNFLLNYNG
jgi:hypothetical protein